jgi:hypothetical protein
MLAVKSAFDEKKATKSQRSSKAISTTVDVSSSDKNQ